MKRLRSFATALWLALALVVGQQAAALHDLGHATESLGSQKGSTPSQHSSDECFLCATLAGAATAPQFAFHLSQATSATPAFHAAREQRTAPRLAFRSRAPPILL